MCTQGFWRPIGRTGRVWLVALVLGCVSPTLPPDDPPEPDLIELGVGVARLSGHVGRAPAFVFVHNRVNGLIFGQHTADGAYEFEVETEPCDPLALWYSAGVFQSTTIVFQAAEVAGPRGACASGSVPSGADAGEDQ